jgi:hypothetical protein
MLRSNTGGSSVPPTDWVDGVQDPRVGFRRPTSAASPILGAMPWNVPRSDGRGARILLSPPERNAWSRSLRSEPRQRHGWRLFSPAGQSLRYRRLGGSVTIGRPLCGRRGVTEASRDAGWTAPAPPLPRARRDEERGRFGVGADRIPEPIIPKTTAIIT